MSYVKNYDVGQIKLDLPYANYIHELPLLSFGDVRHAINLSLIYNYERKNAGDNSFYIAPGFKLNLQKQIKFTGFTPTEFVDENGKSVTILNNGGVYTFDDESQRIIRKVGTTYELEYPDFSKEKYNSDGYITAVVDKYGDDFITFGYDSAKKLISITFDGTKTITLDYSLSKLASISYAGKITTVNFNDNGTIKYVNHYSEVFYKYEYSTNGYRVYSTDENTASVGVREIIYTYSSQIFEAEIIHKIQNVVVDSIRYHSKDWDEDSYIQYNQVDVTNHLGVKTRLQFNYDGELLYSYEISDSGVNFSGDQYLNPIFVNKTDNEFNNSGIGTQKYEDGLYLICNSSTSQWQWTADSQMDETTEGFYTLTGWFKRDNDTSDYTISIYATDSTFDIPKLSPGQWRYFAYKFYHKGARVEINLYGNDGALKLQDFKLMFQKTHTVDGNNVQAAYDEEVLIHKSTGKVIPINSNTFSHPNYVNTGNWIYLQDLIKYKMNQRRGVNTSEIYCNNCKGIITSSTELKVNYEDDQISIDNFDIGRRHFEKSNEYLTKIIIDENSSSLIKSEACINNTVINYQEFDNHFDVVKTVLEGVTTNYTRNTQGLVTREAVSGLYTYKTSYDNNRITVEQIDPADDDMVMATTKYNLDTVWGGIKSIEYPNGLVVTDTNSVDMNALLERSFRMDGENSRKNTLTYYLGNVSSMSDGYVDYSFNYIGGELASVDKDGSQIEQHEHNRDQKQIKSGYPTIESGLYRDISYYDKYGRLQSIDGVMSNTYNSNQYFYYLVNSKSYRYFNEYDKSNHGALQLGSVGNDGAGAMLASTVDHLRGETTRYGYYDGKLTAAVTTDDTYGGVSRQETFSYDDDDRLTGDEFYYDYQNSKRVKSVLNYDDGSASAPTKSNRVKTYSYSIDGTEKAKTVNGFDSYHRINSKSYNIANKKFVKDISYKNEMPDVIIDKYAFNTLANVSYEYDAMGRISSINDGKSITYEYDKYGQLVRENNEVLDKTLKYEYNEDTGNLEYVKTFGYTTGVLSGTPIKTETLTYADNTHADILTKYGTKSITYNSLGCPVSYDGKSFTWSKGKLRSFSMGSRLSFDSPYQTYSYTYDAKGQRVVKSYSYSPGAQTLVDYVTDKNCVYTYDNNGRLIRERRSENYKLEYSITREFTYLYDESGMIGFTYSYEGTTPQAYYYQRNLLGDVIAIYNANGVKQAGYAYDAWGNCTITDSTNSDIANANAIRYRGYYFDQETGWYFLNARYYSPEWRRFISPDDTAYLDPENVNGLNLYCYCNNDPINFVDPSGHLAFWIITALIGAAVGVGITAAVDYIPDQEFNLHWGWYVFGGIVGAAIGAGIGMAVSYTATGTLSASPKWISAFNKAKAGDYSNLLKLSTKNPNSNYVSLGKYISKNSPANYINIAKKHGFTYFDMVKYYNMADKRGFAQIINKMFLEEQHSLGKIFYKTSLEVSNTYGWELGILNDLGVIPQLFLGG